MSDVFAIIVAAGEGRRFGAPKMRAQLKGKSVLAHSLETFEKHPSVLEMVLVLRDIAEADTLLRTYGKIKAVTPGGKRRQDSVYLGVKRLTPKDADIVLIHDAARPLVSPSLIDRVIERTKLMGAAVPALPVSDTIKEIDGKNKVIQTLDRNGLVRIQTPQGFTGEVLKRAYAFLREEAGEYTDEAALVEKSGHDVFIVAGDPRNIKITVPEDIAVAEAFLDD